MAAESLEKLEREKKPCSEAEEAEAAEEHVTTRSKRKPARIASPRESTVQRHTACEARTCGFDDKFLLTRLSMSHTSSAMAPPPQFPPFSFQLPTLWPPPPPPQPPPTGDGRFLFLAERMMVALIQKLTARGTSFTTRRAPRSPPIPPQATPDTLLQMTDMEKGEKKEQRSLPVYRGTAHSMSGRM